MTDKVSLTDLVNLQNETTAVNAINNNYAAITTAMDNTLSRDGTSPNQMFSDFDMNSHRILNLPAPVNYTEPLRLLDLSLFVGGTPISITAQPLPVGGLAGNALVKSTNANYDVSWAGSFRATSLIAPSTGSGLIIGYDGVNGVVQAIANNTTILPIVLNGQPLKFRNNSIDIAKIDASALKATAVLIGPTLDDTVRSLSISNSLYNPNNPLFMQWGASSGSAVIPGLINSSWKTGFIISYIDRTGASVETDTTGFWAEQHVTNGSGSVSAGSFQAYLDSPASGVNHSIVAQYLGANTAVPLTGGSSGMWGQTIGVVNHGNNVTQMIGTEYDMQNSATVTTQKFGIAMLELGAGTVTGTWTPAAGPAIANLKASAAYGVGTGGVSVEPWGYGLLAMQRNNGEGKPISEAIVCASGFDMVNGFGIHFGNMIWSGAGGPLLIPNNTYIKAFNSTAAATVNLIGLNASNLIALGTGATVDPSSGGAVLGSSTIINASINGAVGGGYLEFKPQSASPATGAANTVRLFSNSAGGLGWKSSNGFITILSSTANTTDRGYTFPDANGTFELIDVAQTITGVKTFGAAGNVGKLLIAGTTSGTTILNATAVASGTLTLPAATDTLVGKATTDTLTNKTLTAAAHTGVSTFTNASASSIDVRSGNSANFAELTMGRTASEGGLSVAGGTNDFITGTVAGDMILSATNSLWFGCNSASTARAIKFNTLGQTTFPSGGIFLSGSSSGATGLVSSATASGTLTLPSATDTLVGRATTDTLSNKTLVAPALGVATATSVNGRSLANGSFFAHKNAVDQTGIASATLTNITFGTASSNVGSFYNTGTSTWTPPAGPVMLVSQLFFSVGVVDQNQYQTSILKNGSVVANGINFSSGSSAAAVSAVYIDVANGTDAYTIQGFGGGAGTKTVNGGAINTYFQGVCI